MGTKQRFLGKKARRYIKRHSSTRRKSGGGSEGHNHSLTEWYDSTDSYLGPQLALMTVLSLVGLEGQTKPLLPKRTAS